MKSKIKWIIFVVLLFAIPIFPFYYQNRISVHNGAVKNISLILRNQNDEYWKNVRLGAEAAAKEFNVKLDVTSAEDESDINGQINLINEAVKRNVDALLLAPCSFNDLTESVETAAAEGLPVFTLDSRVNSNKVSCVIATDNESAGKKAGEKIVKLAAVDSVVAVVNFPEKTGSNAFERDKGFMEAVAGFPGIKVIHAATDFKDSNGAEGVVREILYKNNQISAVAALNYEASIGAARAIEKLGLGGKIKLVSFDSDPEEIEYMEKGTIQSSIIQSPFSMGYLGVKNAVLKLQGKKIPKSVESGFTVVDRENMYLTENQKILFPFTQ